jgi:hypothetical protein
MHTLPHTPLTPNQTECEWILKVAYIQRTAESCTHSVDQYAEWNLFILLPGSTLKVRPVVPRAIYFLYIKEWQREGGGGARFTTAKYFTAP